MERGRELAVAIVTAHLRHRETGDAADLRTQESLIASALAESPAGTIRELAGVVAGTLQMLSMFTADDDPPTPGELWSDVALHLSAEDPP